MQEEQLRTREDKDHPVATLDLAYQLAVKRNDAGEIERLQAADMVLLTAAGEVIHGHQLVAEARQQRYRFELQDEVPGTQVVRAWGDVAVVSALLQCKGMDTLQGTRFDHKVWFSDTWVRLSGRWRYVLGQVGARAL